MKTIFYLLMVLLFFIACGNKNKKQEKEEVEIPKEVFMWQATEDSIGNLQMNKVPLNGADLSSPQAILSIINEVNPEIKLDFVKLSNDTVYAKIDDATFLTQQMGSSGSTSYLATVVYNLTELAGVNYVTLTFKEGDHAGPGTFTREALINK
jgi:hypothetical protein